MTKLLAHQVTPQYKLKLLGRNTTTMAIGEVLEAINDNSHAPTMLEENQSDK
jgi:hypothetical protein